MKSLFKLSIILACLLLIIISCSDDPSSIGVNLIGNEYLVLNNFNTQDDSTTQTSHYYKNIGYLGLSSRIFIGKRGDLEASTLMKFDFIINDSLQDNFLDDSIKINYAGIRLLPEYTYNDAAQSMDFTVHKITNYWTSSFYTIDSLPTLTYDNTDLISNRSFNDSLYTFNIDKNIVLSWIKSSIDTNLEKNYGIYFKPTAGSGKIVGFPAFSLYDTLYAKLTVVVEKPGFYTDTLSGFLTSDVSVISGNLPTLPNGEIAVQGGLVVESKLFFDLKNIPKNVIINNAQLILNQDTTNSVLSKSGAGTIRIFSVVDSTTDSVNTSNTVLMTRQDDIFTGNITSFINNWVNYQNNQGMILTTGTQTDNLELVAIKGSNYADFKQRPQIKVVYTSKK